MSGHELTVGTVGHRRARPPRRVRGPGRRPGRPRRRAVAPASSAAARSASASDDDQVVVRVWIVARPGQALGPLTDQVRSAVAATVERLLGLDLGDVTVLVDGVGG